MTPYYTGATSTNQGMVFDFSNPKHRVRLRLEDEDSIRDWASIGGTKDGYAIQFLGSVYYLCLFSDRDYFAYVMQWE